VKQTPPDNEKTRKGAILGAGNVALHGHLPGWLARGDVAITAAADPRVEGRGPLLARIPGLHWYDTAEALLEREEIDFVDICAPPAMHAGLIGKALEKGLHVLCEKPLVLSPEELPPLREAARGKDRVLATVHNWRHAPILAFASRLAREGALGEIRFCRWETLREKPAAAAGDTAGNNWRVDPAVSGGGILMDHGWHALYVVCGWLPEAPDRVRGRLSTRRHREWPIEDTAEVFLESGGGVRAEIFLTWAADERRNRVTIEGTKGILRLDGNLLQITTIGSAEPIVEFPGSLSEGSHHPDWFAGVAAEFLSEIGGTTPRGRSLEEAAACAGLIALARESSRRGGETLAAARPAPTHDARERSAVS
jgi:predicted dehydrogenase